MTIKNIYFYISASFLRHLETVLGGKHTIFLQSSFVSLGGIQEGACKKSVDRPPQRDVVSDGLHPHPVPLCQLQSD